MTAIVLLLCAAPFITIREAILWRFVRRAQRRAADAHAFDGALRRELARARS